MIDPPNEGDRRNTPPDFVNLPLDPRTPPYYAHFTVVAVRGVRDTWTAYFGPPDWPATQVLTSGNKLPLEAARKMFPNIVGRFSE